MSNFMNRAIDSAGCGTWGRTDPPPADMPWPTNDRATPGPTTDGATPGPTTDGATLRPLLAQGRRLVPIRCGLADAEFDSERNHPFIRQSIGAMSIIAAKRGK